MAKINTTISIQTPKGPIALNEMIIENQPILSKESIIDDLAKPIGNGFNTGYVTRDMKRSQTDYAESKLVGDFADFAGATSQAVSTVFADKFIRMDSIVVSQTDLIKLAEGKNGGGKIGREAANFILTGKELDLAQLVTDTRSAAAALKLFTSVGPVNTGDLLEIAATGVQPTQTAFTFAGAIGNIQKGGRITKYTDDGDFTPSKRGEFVKTMANYLTTIGSPVGNEAFYPYSINGIPLNDIRILATYANASRLGDNFTTNMLQITGPDQTRTITGIVGFYDTMKVHITNQLGKDNLYTVCSNRVWGRELDPTQQYIGDVVQGAGSVKMKGGQVKNLGPDDLLVRFKQGRLLAVMYPEEFFALDLKA